MPAHKKWPPGIRDGSDGSDRRDGSGAKMVAQTPPSTRAGGQDDGSLNKLPQIISRVLFNGFWAIRGIILRFKGKSTLKFIKNLI